MNQQNPPARGSFMEFFRGAYREDHTTPANLMCHSVGTFGGIALERFSSALNREGFPLARFCDSESMLVKEADMDGSISIDGFAFAAFGSG